MCAPSWNVKKSFISTNQVSNQVPNQYQTMKNFFAVFSGFFRHKTYLKADIKNRRVVQVFLPHVICNDIVKTNASIPRTRCEELWICWCEVKWWNYIGWRVVYLHFSFLSHRCLNLNILWTRIIPFTDKLKFSMKLFYYLLQSNFDLRFQNSYDLKAIIVLPLEYWRVVTTKSHKRKLERKNIWITF